MSDATTVNGLDRRWLILGVVGLGQVMVIMSLTVMNIALLSAQQALRFSTADRQWVITAYSLAFGSLLLLGDRLADLLGRPRPERQPHKPRPAPPFQHDAGGKSNAERILRLHQ